MKLGILGLGIVGKANRDGFLSLGHEVVGIDLQNINKFDTLFDTDIIFICLPTNGKKDLDNIEKYINRLSQNYKGVVVIRSTVPPGFTDKVKKIYTDLKICMSPEFLKERSSLNDFMNEMNLLVIGTKDKEIFDVVKQAHKHLPQKVNMTSETEAELIKYYANVFAGVRVVFANIMFEICQKFNVDYHVVKQSYVDTKNVTDKYLDVNDNLRGYDGKCIPKDIEQIIKTMKEKDINFSMIETIKKDNDKLKKTVKPGSRKRYD
jgi:UDPglucose 6-dehydrogenase